MVIECLQGKNPQNLERCPEFFPTSSNRILLPLVQSCQVRGLGRLCARVELKVATFKDGLAMIGDNATAQESLSAPSTFDLCSHQTRENIFDIEAVG